MIDKMENAMEIIGRRDPGAGQGPGPNKGVPPNFHEQTTTPAICVNHILKIPPVYAPAGRGPGPKGPGRGEQGKGGKGWEQVVVVVLHSNAAPCEPACKRRRR